MVHSASSTGEGHILATIEGLELDVLDSDLPDSERLDLMAEVHDRHSRIRIILLSDRKNPAPASTQINDRNSVLIRRPILASELLRVVADLRPPVPSR